MQMEYSINEPYTRPTYQTRHPWWRKAKFVQTVVQAILSNRPNTTDTYSTIMFMGQTYTNEFWSQFIFNCIVLLTSDPRTYTNSMFGQMLFTENLRRQMKWPKSVPFKNPPFFPTVAAMALLGREPQPYLKPIELLIVAEYLLRRYECTCAGMIDIPEYVIDVLDLTPHRITTEIDVVMLTRNVFRYASTIISVAKETSTLMYTYFDQTHLKMNKAVKIQQFNQKYQNALKTVERHQYQLACETCAKLFEELPQLPSLDSSEDEEIDATSLSEIRSRQHEYFHFSL